MYIYYEELGDIVSIVLSSDGRSTAIRWKNPSEKAILGLCNSLFKQVELKNWSYDEQTKVWTFMGYVGKIIYTQLESMVFQGLFPNSEVKKIEDLEEKAKAGTLNAVKKVPKEGKFKVEDFFYSPLASDELSGHKLAAKIATLLEVSAADLAKAGDKDLKKLYRAAALRLHPDKNNGDGSKMSELNMLWGIYMSQGG